MEDSLGAFATDTTGKLDVLGHDGDSLGMDGTQVGVFKESNQVSLRGFLKSHNSAGLEPQISLEILGDFSHQSLEGKFADKQFGRFLVATNFTEGDGSRPKKELKFVSGEFIKSCQKCQFYL